MNPRYQLQCTGSEGSFVVRVEGLEPPWIAPPDPKSGMSTNFTTPASLASPFTRLLNRIHPSLDVLPSKKECKFIDISLRLTKFSKFR